MTDELESDRRRKGKEKVVESVKEMEAIKMKEVAKY